MTITMYELLGLIKDGKAPKKIKFRNEIYYWSYDTYTKTISTPDNQHSMFQECRIEFCLYDRIEILPEENEMKEMTYQSEPKLETLYHGFYEDYEFYILNLGTHPTAYVNVQNNPLLNRKDYMEIDINVHGGLTYSEDYLKTDNGRKEGWFIGWDYSNANDYHGRLSFEYPEIGKFMSKKWTTEEIFEDVKDVIEQCINYQEDNEWEDIEELFGDYVVPKTPATENEAYIMACLLGHEQFINKLIKNQKYLKERLDKYDRED